MKILFTFIFVMFFMGLSNAQTNVYHPFPDSNAVWGMSGSCMDVSCGDWQYIKDYTDGDTVIGTYTYKIIREEILMMTSNGCCIPITTRGAGYLREDTATRKVYWRDWYASDTLLYDFSLNIGDTMKGYLCDNIWGGLTVQSIDSVLVGSTYRKRINFDTITSTWTISIIEGIGGTHGLTGCWLGFDGEIKLNCFSVDNVVLYSQGPSIDTIPCGMLPVGIMNLFMKENNIVVYPNPASTTIQFELPVAGEYEINIYDVHGSNALSTTLKLTFAGEENCVDVGNLPSGMYFFEASGKKVFRGRFVKE